MLGGVIGMKFFVGRHTIKLKHKNHRPDLHCVARLEVGLMNALAVDVGAV